MCVYSKKQDLEQGSPRKLAFASKKNSVQTDKSNKQKAVARAWGIGRGESMA